MERFHQAAGTPVQSDSQIGLGLGLYINRTIIEQHQGQVGVESKQARARPSGSPCRSPRTIGRPCPVSADLAATISPARNSLLPSAVQSASAT